VQNEKEVKMVGGRIVEIEFPAAKEPGMRVRLRIGTCSGGFLGLAYTTLKPSIAGSWRAASGYTIS
jgi:hypothetical protein